MNQRNSERSGDLRLSLMAAVIQVCQQSLCFVEFVHITGCLSFSIDNAEKLDVFFSEVVGASPASAPADLSGDVLPPSFNNSEASNKQRRGRRRQCRSDTKKDVEAQLDTKVQSDEVMKSQDEDKTELHELVTVTELYQTVPLEGEGVTSSGPSVDIEPVHLVLETFSSSPSALLSNDIDDATTEDNSRDDSKNCYSCSFCDFSTEHDGRYRSHLRRHRGGARSQTCGTCNKSFVSTAELKRHVTQVHLQLVQCPQCPERFSTLVKLKKHLKVAHGVTTRDMVSCQSCSQRFVTVELLQEHVRSRHEKVCVICNATFTDQRKLVAHRRADHPDAELKCIRCGHRCPTKGALRKHMFTHRDRKHYKCDECEKRFTSGSTLYHHRRAMHGDRKPYQCKICGVSFNFNNSMKLHMLRHGGLRPHKCTTCNKSYLTASHLKHHVRAVHVEAKPFLCSVCHKTFPYENSLRLHKMLHTGERPFTCSFCGKSFVSRSALRAHEESHADNAAYACDVCRKLYKTASLLRAHRRRHTSDGERFMCDVCGQRFMYRSNLETHCAIHSDARSHACSTCGKRFKTYAALYSHQQVHLPSSPFVCEKCGKSFKTRERLRAHESRHLGQKSFVCQICKKAFPDKGGLTKHAKSVHASKPRYSCPACNKTCNRADNLRVHMKTHGNPDLLKLSLQDLAIFTEPNELPLQAENSVLHAATTVLTPLESAPVLEMESGNTVLIQNDHQCLQTLSHNTAVSPLNMLVNSGGSESYGQPEMLGLFTWAVANENQYDAGS